MYVLIAANLAVALVVLGTVLAAVFVVLAWRYSQLSFEMGRLSSRMAGVEGDINYLRTYGVIRKRVLPEDKKL